MAKTAPTRTRIRVEFKDDSLNKAITNLHKAADDIGPALAKPMEQATYRLLQDMQQIPRKNRTAFSRLATAKQRRAFWARVSALRKEGIEAWRPGVGYVRTGSVSKHWSRRIDVARLRVVGTLTNNAPGAIFVQGAEAQQPFHAESGWMTDEKAMQQNQPEIIGYFVDAINDYIWKRFAGQ